MEAADKTRQLAKEVLSEPRNQKEEVRALQDTLYVLGGKWRLPIINSYVMAINGSAILKEVFPGLQNVCCRLN